MTLGWPCSSYRTLAGLQVAVDDPQVVGRLDRAGERRHQLRRGLRVEPAGPLEPVGQAAAGEVLHGQERPAVGVAVLVHLDDVGVLDGGHRLGLGQEPDQLLRPRPAARPAPSSGRPAGSASPGGPSRRPPSRPPRAARAGRTRGRSASPRRATARPAGGSVSGSRSGRPRCGRSCRCREVRRWPRVPGSDRGRSSVARAGSESPERVASAAGCGGRAGDGSSPCVAPEESVGSWGHMPRPSGSSATT